MSVLLSCSSKIIKIQKSGWTCNFSKYCTKTCTNRTVFCWARYGSTLILPQLDRIDFWHSYDYACVPLALVRDFEFRKPAPAQEGEFSKFKISHSGQGDTLVIILVPRTPFTISVLVLRTRNRDSERSTKISLLTVGVLTILGINASYWSILVIQDSVFSYTHFTKISE